MEPEAFMPEAWDETENAPQTAGISLRTGLNILTLVVALTVILAGVFVWRPSFRWFVQRPPVVTAARMTSGVFFTQIAMLNAQEGWAIGSIHRNGVAITTIEHYQNNAWTVELSDARIPALNALAVVAADDVWALGDQGTILHYVQTCPACHQNPGLPPPRHWVSVPSPTPEQLVSIVMVSSNEGWAISSNATMLQYLHGVWTVFPVHQTVKLALLNWIALTSPTDGWVAGIGRLFHYDGHTWTAQAAIQANTITAIAMLSPHEGWAAGSQLKCVPHLECDLDNTQAILFHLAQGQWQPVVTLQPNGITIVDIQMLATDDGWAVGQHIGNSGDAIIFHDLHGQWRRVALSPALTQGRQLTGIAMVAPDEGWLVGTNGLMLHYTQGAWEAVG